MTIEINSTTFASTSTVGSTYFMSTGKSLTVQASNFILDYPNAFKEPRKKTKTDEIMEFLCPEEEIEYSPPNKNGRSYPTNS